MLAPIDIGILVVYFVITLVIGLYAQRKAKHSLDDYFLGSRTIPWYILGLSGMAAFLDMSGTMLQTSFFFFLGVKGYWVAFRGAVALFLAFFMIFMAKWLVRSRVMTVAELIALRFGSDWQGNLARILSALSAIIISITMISYFFIGAGKFFHLYVPAVSPGLVASALFAFVMLYTVTSGFFGVVYTEVFQGLLILGVIVFITAKAVAVGTPEYYAEHVGTDWLTLFPRTWEMEMPAGYESLESFGILILFWLLLNVLQGFANPIDAMSAQKFFAAPSERDGALAALQWILLLSLRFLLMVGMAVLAISVTDTIADPEMTLPTVIERFLPIGIKGLFIAALLAALMSTVEALVNASAAYFVRDVYQRFVNPEASERRLVRMSYATTAAVFVLGGAIGFFGESLNAIWSWLMMGFIVGLIPPGILKWVWWRFNALGFAGGMIAGIVGAGLQGIVLTNPPEYGVFLFVIACSTAGTLAGVYLGNPTEAGVLQRFYEQIRPFGAWGPVKRGLPPETVRAIDRENRRDLLLLIPACAMQMTVFWLMVAIVVERWDSVWLSLGILTLCGVILYRYWYKNLPRGAEAATQQLVK